MAAFFGFDLAFLVVVFFLDVGFFDAFFLVDDFFDLADFFELLAFDFFADACALAFFAAAALAFAFADEAWELLERLATRFGRDQRLE